MVSITSNNTEQDRAPVYIPFKTFISAIETLEQGLPPSLDRSAWPSFSGGVQSQTLGAFKFLGLIDETTSQVQPILKQLVEAKGETRKEILRRIIEDKYAEAIQLGQKNATFQSLQEYFRKYGVQGGTLDRVIRFFLDACSYTGAKCSPMWAKAKKSSNRRSPKKDDLPPKEKFTDTGNLDKTPANIKTVTLRSGGTISLSLSIDMLALTPEDRTWLFELIDRLNSYGNADEQK